MGPNDINRIQSSFANDVKKLEKHKGIVDIGNRADRRAEKARKRAEKKRKRRAA